MTGLWCPYCDGRNVKLRENLSMHRKESRIVAVDRLICRECGETSYAVQVYTAEPDSYECVRREDLEPRYGVRERRFDTALSRRWARWPA